MLTIGWNSHHPSHATHHPSSHRHPMLTIGWNCVTSRRWTTSVEGIRRDLIDPMERTTPADVDSRETAQDGVSGVGRIMSSLTKVESPDRMTRAVRERAGLSSGRGRRGLVHHREFVPRDRSRVGFGLVAQVPGLPQRMATRVFTHGRAPAGCAVRRSDVGATACLAQRMDEALSPAGDAADRPVDPHLVGDAAPRSAQGPGDDLPALPLSARSASIPTSRSTTASTTLLSTGPAQARTHPCPGADVVRASDATVCVSRLRTEELRSLVPEAAGADSPYPAWCAHAVHVRAPTHAAGRAAARISRTCRAPIWATSVRWRTGSIGS